MVLSMPSPYKHPKTGVYWYRQRVPAAVRHLAAGRTASVPVAGKPHALTIGAELKVSLDTKDPREAKDRAKETQAAFDLVWLRFANAPARLTHKQIVALSGEIYRWFEGEFGDDPEAVSQWAALRRQEADAAKMYAASPHSALMIPPPSAVRNLVGLAVDHYLAVHHQSADLESRDRLLFEFDRAFGYAAELMARRADGDYSPDPAASRFPAIALPTLVKQEVAATDRGVLTLSFLLDRKQATQSNKSTTLRIYRSAIADFIKLIGHERAFEITQADVVRWRDDLMRRGLATKTINDGYLAALKSTLAHGVKEHGLAANAASVIRDERKRPDPTGSKGYSVDQARAILAATFNGTKKSLSPPHQRAAFWVPWLCAYTGLRVSEITQFRGRNLRHENGVHIMLITPEDGSTKGGNAWTTGIHEHLIALGLLDMFEAVGDGPAFYTPYPNGEDLRAIDEHRAKESADRVGNWITDELGVEAPGGRPNHAWRHTFTTLSRTHRLDKEARDYMMGSRSQTDAREGYGDWPPEVVDAEVNRLPRFTVTETEWRPSLERVRPLSPRAAPAPRPQPHRSKSVGRPRATRGTAPRIGNR